MSLRSEVRASPAFASILRSPFALGAAAVTIALAVIAFIAAIR